MTTGLLIAAALLLGAALWLLLFHENLVAALWYRLFNDPEPYHPDFAETPDDGYERVKYFTGEEAATPQVAAPVPAVVAGSDLDRLCRADRAQTALWFRLLVDESLSDLRGVDVELAPLYVLPEVER